MNQNLQFKDHKTHLNQMIQAALLAVDPYTAAAETVSLDEDLLVIGDRQFSIKNSSIFVVAIGKAAIPMCNGLVAQIGSRITAGVAVTKAGQDGQVDHPRIKTLHAAHPVSDQRSVAAGEAVSSRLDQTTAHDLVLFLISGGASALCTLPQVGLEQWQSLSRDLLASGCSIQEFNTVRKQLDWVKGGGLGLAAQPARIMTLILSDVVGNPVDMIGSGPTVPTAQGPQDALEVLAQYQIDNPLVTNKLEELSQSFVGPAQFDSPFQFIGDLNIALAAAEQAGLHLGFEVSIQDAAQSGEAREVGRQAAEIGRGLRPGQCLLFGGETTVTLKGDGLGGRNQELALAAALGLDALFEDCEGVVIATFATDGDDGPTDAAGAIVTRETVRMGLAAGLEAKAFLDINDSHSYFKQLGQHLIITGQTGTNVNDLLFVMRY